jgi:ketosteroid isomerase-like protein
MSDEADIKALFGQYMQMWNDRDFAEMAALFAEPSISIGPEGPTITPNNAAMAASLEARFERLEAENFDHTEIEAVVVQLADADTATADLKNVRRLRRDGSAIDELDALYILNRIGGAWKLSVAMAGAPGWRDRKEKREPYGRCPLSNRLSSLPL